MAPLAATIAATAAVSVGVVLARANSERRSQRRRDTLEDPDLMPVEPLSHGLRRMAMAQADLAIEQLRGDGETARAIHEARKAIKRIRSIVRLLEGELGSTGCAHEQAALRGIAARLAGARDAEVMLATLETLVGKHGGALAGKKGVARLRAHLGEERELAERRAHDGAARMLAGEELHAFRLRASAWSLPERPGIASADVGLRRIYRQGRRRYRRARHSGSMHAMHQWRKRVKDLRYAAEALSRSRPGAGGSSGKFHRLEHLAHRADALGEVLGEEHDLAVLGAWLGTPPARRCAGPRIRRKLRRAIVRRRARLRKEALREGKRLYRRKPGRFVTRVARSYERRSIS